jgi:hypothetical protein
MHADVDMSGRIEETNRPTALGLANGVRYSVLISAHEKRLAIEGLRYIYPHWSRRLIHVRLFSTVLYLLLQNHLPRIALVTVDPEYPGYERDIKDWVLSLCRRQNLQVFADQITFRSVGKKSPAHHLAYGVYKGKSKPDQMITAREVLAEFRQ